MKREVLFQGFRNEEGDLFLEVTETAVALYMSADFWKQVIQRLDRSASTDSHLSPKVLTRTIEVMQILKAGLKQQQQQEEEAEKRT